LTGPERGKGGLAEVWMDGAGEDADKPPAARRGACQNR